MENNPRNPSKTPHAPGAGSDKQHPEPQKEANQSKSNKQQKKENVSDNPGTQNTG